MSEWKAYGNGGAVECLQVKPKVSQFWRLSMSLMEKKTGSEKKKI